MRTERFDEETEQLIYHHEMKMMAENVHHWSHHFTQSENTENTMIYRIIYADSAGNRFVVK